MILKDLIEGFIGAHFSKTKLAGLTGALFILTVFLVGYFFLNLPDGNLHIFFFDVGQGDSILIKTPDNQKILIDGGPDNQVLTRLGSALPFYDRTIDVIVATHPQADHITGLIEVLKRYQVNMILYHIIPHNIPEYNKFQEVIKQKKIPTHKPIRGEKIDLGSGVNLYVLWPPGGEAAGQESSRWVESQSDPNETSIILRLEYKEFAALFTGDAGETVQQTLLLLEGPPSPVTVFKVPHHGSTTGLDEEFLALLRPQLAVISVGRQNRFDHPSKRTIRLLDSTGTKILRTDQEGTIEVVSDGKSWWVKSGGN